MWTNLYHDALNPNSLHHLSVSFKLTKVHDLTKCVSLIGDDFNEIVFRFTYNLSPIRVFNKNKTDGIHEMLLKRSDQRYIFKTNIKFTL